jgi:hypothetical protein
VADHPYFPHFSLDLRFDDRRARELLDPLGIRATPVGEYFDTLIDFAEAARWGRTPLDRARVGATSRANASGDPRIPEQRDRAGEERRGDRDRALGRHSQDSALARRISRSRSRDPGAPVPVSWPGAATDERPSSSSSSVAA